MEDVEMKQIEINIMALLMEKERRDNGLPKDEENTLKKLIREYSKEHKLIKEGKKPY